MFVYVPVVAILWILVFAFIAYFAFKLLDRLWRIRKIGNITNRYVLVTGCDSGFGFEIAKHLDAIGARVFAACLTEAGEEKVKEACSTRTHTIRLDVTDHTAIKHAVDYVRKTMPSEKDLWGVVNNAGLQMIHAPIELHTNNDIDRTMAVNLMGVIHVTRAFMPLLRKSRGRIVNISSDCGFITWACRFAYCITKQGVESFTSCIRREMYHTGISAHTVQPGAFKTSIITPEGMVAQLQNGYDKADPEVRDYYGRAIFDMCKNHYYGIPDVQDPDMNPVYNAVEHALFSVHPKRSYRAGKDINGWIYPLSLLPVWFIDWYTAMCAPEKARQT